MMAEQFDVPAPTARQRWTAVTALAGSIGLAGFVLVACGGGSAKSASSAPALSTASSAAGSSAAGSSAAGSSAAGSSSTATSSAAGSAASSSVAIPHGSSSSSFCAFARAVSSQQNKNVAVFTSGDPAAIQRLEKQELAVLTQAVSTAPSSIRPSMIIIQTTDQALYKELQAVKFDFRKLTPSQTKDFDSPALIRASDTVTSYITNVCHISTATATAH